VELLAAPWHPCQAELVSPRGLRLLLAMARARFDRIILDLDSRIDEVQLEGLWQSDPILAVTRMDYLSIRSARRILDRLGEMGIDTTRVRVVANRFGQPHELTVAQAESALAMKVNSFVVDDARRVNRSTTEGRLVAMRSSWPKISRNLSALANTLNGKLC
jgi:pilus assembly protein CpaE